MPLSLIFTQPGTFTIDDNGIPGDNISVIRDSNGVVIFTFAHPADALNLTVSTPGVNIIVNFTDSLNAANFSIGSLINAAQSPDSIVMQNVATTGAVTLTATGSIAEGSDADAAADIVAGQLIMSAGTGIGTPGNAIETQTGLLEAETVTGGINIGNFGNVQIGGFSADVDGLDVVTSGDIIFTNLGTILLSDETSFDSVHGGDTGGNVTLIANGYDSDIIANVDQSSIIAPRGSVFLTAGRDISFGLAGADFGNDVRANNDIVVNAGRDFLISGFADFFANGVLGNTGGNLIVNAGRNVSLLDDTGNSASLATLGTGGSVIVTTGANGTFTLEPPSTNAISSGGGDVVINADRMVISASTGITSPGTVTLRPVTDGRAINLGSLTDAAFALELSDAELDRIFTQNLVLGANEAGPVTVSAAISPLNAPNLIIRSGTDINVNANITGLVSLSLRALDNVFQTAASSINAGTFTIFVDAVDDDPGVGGIATLNGGSAVVSTIISGNLDADTLNGNGVANILLGLAGNDTLRGFGGNDTLDGGTGVDSMNGGLGDDIFYVDDAGDVVAEAVSQGRDVVYASVGYTLPAGSSIEVLSSVALGAITALNLTGNEFAQEIYGNAGANMLSGGGGADFLAGLGGDDIYFISSGSEIIAEDAGQGRDIVYTGISYALNSGAQVEILSTSALGSTAAINLTGNGFAQEIYGNAGANTLNGGGGADFLAGLGGDDIYFISSGIEILSEDAGQGRDIVYTGISYALNAGAQIEILSTNALGSTAAINLTGNAFGQEIYGNAGANTLNGGGGADFLAGGGGADSFAFTTALGPTNIDTILDYQVGVDRFQLDDAVFAGLAPGALPAGAFRSGTAAQDADDRIIYNPATGALLFDADGNGAGAAVQFASLSTGLALSAGDFTVI